jgi:hypothetical protein
VTRSGDKLVIGRTRSNPTKADTDRGGVSDRREVKLGSDPSQIKSSPNDLESRMRAPRSGWPPVG